MSCLQQMVLAEPVYAAPSQQAYTTPGTYTWTCPAGVFSVSVVCVGAGGGCGPVSGYYAGGGGGALAYANSIEVAPGVGYTVVVGAGGTPGNTGGTSSFNATVCAASGGSHATGINQNAPGGTVLYGAGGAGGVGGSETTGTSHNAGGGGAGGTSNAGGIGGNGAVRIIWPGFARQFPSTGTADQ